MCRVALMSVSLVSFWIHSTPAVAQREDPPRLALDFRGPAGETEALGFLLGGARFFAGGQNKVIQLYDFVAGKGVPGNALRWEFSRSVLGNINCAVPSVDEKLIFVAGVSARGTRDIVALDSQTGETKGVFPSSNDKEALEKYDYKAVLSLAVSPDGNWLASGNVSGDVWLWQVKGQLAGGRGRQVIRGQGATTLNPLGFLGEDLMCVERMGASVRVQLFNPSTGAIRYLGRNQRAVQNSLNALSYSGEPIAIAASRSGNAAIVVPQRPLGRALILLYTPRGPTVIPVDNVQRLRAGSISPNGEWIAVTGETVDAKSVLLLINVDSRQVSDRVLFNGVDSCVHAVFSPESTELLSHDDSSESLVLFDISEDAGPHPLSAPVRAPRRMFGRGRNVLNARFIKQRSSLATGYAIRVTDSSDISLDFSASEGILSGANEAAEVIDGNTFRGRWELQIIRRDEDHRLILTSPDATKHEVAIDLDEQGPLTGAYCFLPDQDGNPWAVAVGTTSFNGIYVYRLAEIRARQNADLSTGLVRYFRDHNGRILDLSVSSDGRFLVSTGADKSIKFWSLSELGVERAQSILGARLAIEGNQLVFRDVNPAGISFARKAREGSVLNRVGFRNAKDRPVTTFQQPQQMLQVFQQQSPLHQKAVWIKEQGTRFEDVLQPNDDRILITPGWEPLLTLVVDNNNDWALFTPEGYYNASFAEGNRLFGWQLNGRNRGDTPRFEPAENLQAKYERPDVIRKVLSLGSVDAAFANAGTDYSSVLRKSVNDLPRVSIISPADGAEFEIGTTVDIIADVRYSPDTDPNAFNIEASNNGRFLGKNASNERVERWRWSCKVTDALSRVRVVATEDRAGVTKNLKSEALVTLRGTVPTQPLPKPEVFFVGIAAENYDDRMGYSELSFTVEDVESVRNELRKHPFLSRHFSESDFMLIEEQVTRENISSTFQEVRKVVKERGNPEDLIIVYVSGHGIRNEQNEYFFVPPPPARMKRENSFSDWSLERFGVPWTDLSDPINEVGCHVVWFVDTCHAGAAAESKSGFRDTYGRHGRRVLWAAQGDQESRESVFAIVRDNDDEVGHGCFTMAVLETLIGNETDRLVQDKAVNLLSDGVLNFQDIADYVSERVPDFVSKKLSGASQNPVYAPKPTHARNINLLEKAR